MLAQNQTGQSIMVDLERRRRLLPVPGHPRSTIVFGTKGDLWQVARSGGVASWLTATRPTSQTRQSPRRDGPGLLGRVRGPTEVYTMPLAGSPAMKH